MVDKEKSAKNGVFIHDGIYGRKYTWDEIQILSDREYKKLRANFSPWHSIDKTVVYLLRGLKLPNQIEAYLFSLESAVRFRDLKK